MPFGKALNGSVEHVHKLLMKLWNRKEEIKILYGGPGKGETAIIGKLLENMEYIMAGHEGEKMPLEEKQLEKTAESAPVVYQRWMPHPPDRHHDDPAEVIYKRMMTMPESRLSMIVGKLRRIHKLYKNKISVAIVKNRSETGLFFYIFFTFPG